MHKIEDTESTNNKLQNARKKSRQKPNQKFSRVYLYALFKKIFLEKEKFFFIFL